MGSLCRSCMMQGSVLDMKSLDGVFGDLFQKCHSIKVLPEDPQQICTHCYKQTTAWISFKMMVQQKNQLFRKAQARVSSLSLDHGNDNDSGILMDFECSQEQLEAKPGDVDLPLDPPVVPKDCSSGIKEEEIVPDNQQGNEPKDLYSDPSELMNNDTQEEIIVPKSETQTEESLDKPEIPRDLKVKRESETLEIEDFICPLCGGELLDLSSLRDHLKEVHLKGGKTDCPICDSKFNRTPKVCAHIISTHKWEPQSVPKVKALSPQKTAIPKVIKCPICDTRMKEDQVFEHLKVNHFPKGKSPCSLCPGTYKDAAKHVWNKHCKWWICPKCPATGENSYSSCGLKEHTEKEHPEIQMGKRSCVACGCFIGLSLARAFAHIKAKHSETQCPVCGQCFQRVEEVVFHMFESHPQTEALQLDGRIKCHLCTDRYIKYVDYQKHIPRCRSKTIFRRPKKQNPIFCRDLVCRFCGTKCESKGNLRTHIRLFHAIKQEPANEGSPQSQLTAIKTEPVFIKFSYKK